MCEKRLRDLALYILEKSRRMGGTACNLLLPVEESEWSRSNSHRLLQKKTPLVYKEKSVYNDLALEQLMQKYCVISIPEDLHTSFGQGPEQPDINLKLALL